MRFADFAPAPVYIKSPTSSCISLSNSATTSQRHFSTPTGLGNPRHSSKQESVREILSGVFRGGPSPEDSGSGEDGAAKADDKPKITQQAMQRFISLAYDQRWQIAAASVTVLASSGISLIFPAAIGQVLDVALDPNSSQTPSGIAIGLAALFGLQSGMIMLRSGLLSVAGERIAADLRSRVFDKLLQQDVSWHDTQRVGSLTNTLSNDISKMQSSLTNNITSALRSIAMTGTSAVMLFVISPKLAALSCMLVPPTIVSAVFFGRYMKRKQAAVQRSLANTLSVAEEVMSNIRVVRQFAAEGREGARYSQAVDGAFGHARSVGIAGAVFDGTVHAGANFAIIAVLWYGGNQVLVGDLSAGQLTSFLMYSLYAAFNSSNLSTVYADFSKGVGASEKVFEILDSQPKVSLQGGATALPALPQPHTPQETEDAAGISVGPTIIKPSAPGIDIRFDNVTFAYPQRPTEAVLDKLSMHVPSGQHAALVGASGSGKSTVGSLITRLYEPSSGTITANGTDIASLDASWWRSNIGVVQQDAPLFSGSIAHNIAYGVPGATMHSIREAAKVAQADQFISALSQGYETEVGERGVRLSGGQRQRLCIARAVLLNPRLVLLDEATSAQDAATEADMHEALQQFLEKRTVLSVAHRLSTIQAADHVNVLAGGKLAEEGHFDDLTARKDGVFRQLVSKQLSVD